MRTRVSRVLDECLARISNGETIEACLAQHPTMKQQLEPLLHTAQSISAVSRVSPSDDFRRISKTRLVARLRLETTWGKAANPDELVGAWQMLSRAITGLRRVAIPVTLALLLALVGGLLSTGIPNSTSTSPTLASNCTLSIFSGSVEVLNPSSGVWEQAQDSIILEVGSRVRTAPESQAVLTFFEGSTLHLEANTDVEIQQLEYTEEQDTIIIIRQWLGRTWSRVVQMSDPGSHYEIQTPSAYALVRGTLFMTEVDQAGATTVQTIEGLVAVGSQIEEADIVDTPSVEVNVPAGYGTQVEFGAAPSEPIPVEPPAQGPDGGGPPGQSDNVPPGQGPDGGGPPGQGDKDKEKDANNDGDN